ncbi:MAPEG family protein [Acidisphaera rubrifaciens]|uniref:Eicosanoid/glutathione metabolism protein membrane-associated n=1 Tax=Acidisphaera rubrifaciens HS-AP3 TaxID=1231350 RepID=A0A0D6P849_9PROT|nr:MAPEG family protein [Acidisphaera rubrifaciens]GAN77516.1 eicosanoid/glutathione metabolism protein membrane-associated [Acidisphaera rubrifaciens HS-AP3]
MSALPVTSVTAGLLGLLALVLAIPVTVLRFRTGRSLGEDAPGLQVGVRSHANFAEYAPIGLILLAIAEHDLGSSRFVLGLAVALVLGRVMHPIGMRMRPPNVFRAGGIILTWAMIGVASLHALTHLSG